MSKKQNPVKQANFLSKIYDLEPQELAALGLLTGAGAFAIPTTLGSIRRKMRSPYSYNDAKEEDLTISLPKELLQKKTAMLDEMVDATARLAIPPAILLGGFAGGYKLTSKANEAIEKKRIEKELKKTRKRFENQLAEIRKTSEEKTPHVDALFVALQKNASWGDNLIEKLKEKATAGTDNGKEFFERVAREAMRAKTTAGAKLKEWQDQFNDVTAHNPNYVHHGKGAVDSGWSTAGRASEAIFGDDADGEMRTWKKVLGVAGLAGLGAFGVGYSAPMLLGDRILNKEKEQKGGNQELPRRVRLNVS